MKRLLSLLLVLVPVSVFAQTERVNLDWVEDFPVDMLTSLGSFECTAGGTPVGLYQCSEGSGIHIRGMEGYTCLLTPDLDPVATARFDFNANWDADYTGPVYGNWMVVPGDVCDLSMLQDPEHYFAGTYTGKRWMMMEGAFPVWIGDWKFEGWGVGNYTGVQFKSTAQYTLYTALPLPYEMSGVGTGPEGVVQGMMIFHDE